MRGLRDSGRSASADEQAVLARWSGWGAVPQVFDEHLDAYAAERAQLRRLLTAQEYAAARRSTINAHYTDAALVGAIWDGLHQLGFTGGQVLEPGCGSGHFIGLAPPAARMLGVELEPVSAAIAAALYPHARIVTGSFAALDVAEASVDAVVGNVPFAKVALHDPRHNSGNHSIHNHFIIKSLHLTRPGGLVAVLTSRYSMDAVNPAARAEMAQLADLVGAIRLPSGAHRRAAGTDAITDLLILRRREPGSTPRVDFGATWEKSLPTVAGDTGALVEINQYFREHPDNVLGALTVGRGQHRDELTVAGDLTTTASRFAAALQRLAADARERGLVMSPRAPGSHQPRPAQVAPVIDPHAAAFAGFLSAHAGGTFTRRVGGADQPYTPPAKQATELRLLLQLRDTAMDLINAEQACIDDTDHLHALRGRLNTAYDAYVAAYGPVNRCTQRRQLRQSWHVFAEWCDQHERTKLPATAETVRDYLSDLRHRGLGRDQLQRHLDGITTAHTSAHNRQLAKAITTVIAQAGGDQRRETRARQMASTDPTGLLQLAALADLRLTADAHTAGQDVLAGAPPATNTDLDLDALGLRTTVILRPPQGGFRDDPFANVVRALERFDPTTQTARKADIFTRRVINPPRTRLGADTPEEALSICLDTHSRVDLPEIARLLGLPDPQQARAALGELVYDDPDTREPVWAREYLSGNVRQKLALARAAAEHDPTLAVNVAALQHAVPADLGPQDIEIRLGSWIGPSYVQQFLRELLGDTKVRVEHVAGLWHVAGHGHTLAATDIWGGGGLNAYQLTERLLIGSEIRVTRTITEPNDRGELVEREVLDPHATEEAKDKARELGDRFADWVWEDTTRAQELIQTYNDTFNAEIPPDYHGVELSLPGLSTVFTLREHQKTAVARIVYQPATGLIHDVGAGKTLEMIAGVMERRRRGLTAKPAVVVPNDSIAEQFEREWLQAYPSARLLTATSADLTSTQGGRDKRAELVARVATGDWDAVIMTKESFQRIPLHPEAQEQFLAAELDALRDAKQATSGSLSHTMTKRLETAMAAAEERLKKRLAGIDRDTTGVTLRDSGIDFLVIDEAQNYKNGAVASSLPGLAIDGADRSLDLDMKLAWLADTHHAPRAVLATATPFTNTFSEIYLWQRRLGHHLPAFDVWARTYCTSESFMEMTPGGNLRAKSRMRRIINEPELWQSLRLTSDIKMKADLNLPTPTLRGGQVQIITVPAATEARIVTLDLARRERQLSGRAEKGADNHLVIQHDGQLAALDLRTLGIHTQTPQKVDHLADDIHTEWAAARHHTYLRDDGTDHPVPGGLILVFCDESTPTGHGWNFYTELKQQLITRGLPEHTIRFIHEATSPQRKADLLAACREGAVSVLIGSTMKMGAGINVQTRALGGYEITGPWRPDIPAQARGRVDRQGNQNQEFFWKRVVTAPSMDAKKWEITAQKHGMFAPLYTNTPPSRTREVTDDQSIGLADVMAAATGDARYREKAELDQEHKALHRQRSAHQRTQQSLKLRITSITKDIPQLEAKAHRQDTTAARRTDTRGDAFHMTITGHTYRKRADAADALKNLLTTTLAATARTPEGQTIDIGTLGGYQLAATLQPLREYSIHLTFPDAAENTTGLALDHRNLPERHGLITRLENQLDIIAGAAAETRELIDEQRRSLNHARTAITKQFPHEQRLADVTRRRAELITELSNDHDHEPTTLDPDSAEAKARAERAEARHRERQQLHAAARAIATPAGVPTTTSEDFAAWYVEIAAPVTADQRPPAQVALAVWHDLGRPRAHGAATAPRSTLAASPPATARHNDPAAVPSVEAAAPRPAAAAATAPQVADASAPPRPVGDSTGSLSPATPEANPTDVATRSAAAPSPTATAAPLPAVPQSPDAGAAPAQRRTRPVSESADGQAERYAQINKAAARWFEKRLQATPAARDYLHARLGGQHQIEQVLQRGFVIGYAPPQRTALLDHLRAAGHPDDDLTAAGVALIDHRGRTVDRFRNRIMFAVHDSHGTIAGFTGRSLTDHDPKYLNTPTTALFNKSSLLFGLYEQRDLAGRADPVFVEGPVDVLAIAAHDPHQQLLPVGACGTALTTNHLNAVDALVAAHHRRVIAMDGDPAGQKAALARAEDAVRRYPHLDLTVLPDNLDPAAFATHTSNPLAAYLGPPHTRPALDVLVDARLHTWADQLQWIEGRIGAARHIAGLLATIEPTRAAPLALQVATRLDLDPTTLAELIATANPPADNNRTTNTRTAPTSPTPAATATAQTATAKPPPAQPTGKAAPASDVYAAEGWQFITDLTDVTELLRTQHWTLAQNTPVEIGNAHTQHWRRHDTTIAVTITPDDRVLTTLFIRHGPPHTAHWDELDITTTQQAHELIEQAGLHGLAQPTQHPGHWHIHTTHLAAHARATAAADSTRHLITRPADARDHTWRFAHDGTPVTPAPPPQPPMTSRDDVINHVLGHHTHDAEIRELVATVLAGRTRNNIQPREALRRLATTDQNLYRRAITASAGHGRPFDVHRAQTALHRLANDDPTLPLNSLGHYTELTERQPHQPHQRRRGPAPTHTIRGIVVDITPGPLNTLHVTIERDHPTDTGNHRATQAFPADGTVTLLDPATRPATAHTSPAPRPATHPVTPAPEPTPGNQPRTTTDQPTTPTKREPTTTPAAPKRPPQPATHPPVPQPDQPRATTRRRPTPAAEQPSLWEQTAQPAPAPPILPAATTTNSNHRPAPASVEPLAVALNTDDTAEQADPITQEWAALVAKAAHHGFTVHTNYSGESHTDTSTHTILVAFDQPPLSRIADLATMINNVAHPTNDHDRHHATALHQPPPAAEVPPPVDTPIYDALCHEMRRNRTNGTKPSQHMPNRPPSPQPDHRQAELPDLIPSLSTRAATITTAPLTRKHSQRT